MERADSQRTGGGLERRGAATSGFRAADKGLVSRRAAGGRDAVRALAREAVGIDAVNWQPKHLYTTSIYLHPFIQRVHLLGIVAAASSTELIQDGFRSGFCKPIRRVHGAKSRLFRRLYVSRIVIKEHDFTTHVHRPRRAVFFQTKLFNLQVFTTLHRTPILAAHLCGRAYVRPRQRPFPESSIAVRLNHLVFPEGCNLKVNLARHARFWVIRGVDEGEKFQSVST